MGGEENERLGMLRMEADLRLATLRQEKAALDLVRGVQDGATEDESDLRSWADWLRREVNTLSDEPEPQVHGRTKDTFPTKVPSVQASPKRCDIAAIHGIATDTLVDNSDEHIEESFHDIDGDLSTQKFGKFVDKHFNHHFNTHTKMSASLLSWT